MTATITLTVRDMIEMRKAKREIEAQVRFAMAGKSGKKMRRETWANGAVMVSYEGSLPTDAIPLETATKIWKAGWKVAS